ncbi:hypothetical protein scyTo_0021243 [Scyliorhinus torazame]|uniref:Uncharacterized protein n=1 Tax=Scyliorhinus torazame TaxID=75743 RepID=A0A401Q0L4_SCYTO|nr:hypothetical protein [Scyliorhinus torazame]
MLKGTIVIPKDNSRHLHGRKVLELADMHDKPYQLESNSDDNQTRDCSTVCATQLPLKVLQTNMCVDYTKFTHNGTNVRKNKTLFGQQQHSNGQEVVVLAVKPEPKQVLKAKEYESNITGTE